jgi:Zn-finger nucleic acid-binding protein
MKCPACENQLQQMTVADVTVDICKGGCGGIWFDQFELQKFDEPHESAGQALLEVERKEGLAIDRSKPLNCPKCEGVVMMRHFFSVKQNVEVDECAGCGGFWLDAGELATIRSLFDTEQQRRQAAQQYFNDLFGDKFAAIKANEQEKLAKTRKITNMFRFICPTYYIPGRQTWGAF